MRVLHVNAGLEDGGGLTHIVSLLKGMPHREVSLLVFAEGPVAKAARAANIDVMVLQYANRYNPKALREILQVIADGHFDIVHAHGARAVFFLRLIQHKIKAKVVATVHSDPLLDFMHRGLPGKIFTQLYIRSLRHFDHLYAVSSPFYTRLQSFGIPDAHLTLILNGIDFQADVPAPVAHTGLHMLYVARLQPVKNHALLLNALHQLERTDWHLTLVGDGPEKANLQAQIQALHLEDHVKLAGFMRPEAISQLYPRTDLAVLTSISESFPLVLLEAANYAVPILSADVGDVPKLIANPSLGYLFKQGNQGALVTQLHQAFADWGSGQLLTKGQNVRAYAMAHFTLTKLRAQLWDSYRQLLAE